MKLSDKRFWLYEAMITVCTAIIGGFVLYKGLSNFLLIFPIVVIYLPGGLIAWILYNGNQWWKLAGYLFIITTLIVAIALFGFIYDWNPETGNLPPANISPDEGKWLTNHETVWIMAIAWLVITPLPTLVASYLAKRLLNLQSDKH